MHLASASAARVRGSALTSFKVGTTTLSLGFVMLAEIAWLRRNRKVLDMF
jgi:hypothetical protein